MAVQIDDSICSSLLGSWMAPVWLLWFALEYTLVGSYSVEAVQCFITLRVFNFLYRISLIVTNSTFKTSVHLTAEGTTMHIWAVINCSLVAEISIFLEFVRFDVE